MWFLVAFARRESFALLPYLRETIFRPLIVFGPVVVLTIVLAPALHLPLSLSSLRFSTLADVALAGVLFSLAMAACAWFGLLSVSERTVAARYLPGGAHSTVRRMLRCGSE